MNDADLIIRQIQICIAAIRVVLILLTATVLLIYYPEFFSSGDRPDSLTQSASIIDNQYWALPDSSSIPTSAEGGLIRYGYNLITHTAVYLGPKGKVLQISNGMNCQNCHLEAGRKLFANNFSGVASTYPKHRERSGTLESVEKRVNDCLERSLNGKPLNEDSREMQAFVAYINWVGSNVPKGTTPKGAGLMIPDYMDRAADVQKGLKVYVAFCSRCHGPDGKGQRQENSVEWEYPPLFGNESYNVGAGLFRISRLAGYVQANMPNDLATFGKAVLTDEQAWDVAAYVNSMPRPDRDVSSDWPNLLKKPVDHPYGPYADNFSETQHKYGPFKNMMGSR